jgi:hypothetical protein
MEQVLRSGLAGSAVEAEVLLMKVVLLAEAPRI